MVVVFLQHILSIVSLQPLESDHNGGTGIYNVNQRLVHLLGESARLHIRNLVSGGSEVKFSIPIPNQYGGKAGDGMNIRVMIAEDEMMARKELLYLLSEEKGVILTPHAETGEQVIELYSEHRPDVIFLDVEMPGFTGIEAARYIMKQETDTMSLICVYHCI